jgi:hypothetical protein
MTPMTEASAIPARGCNCRSQIKHWLSSGLRMLQSAGLKQPTNIFTRDGCAALQVFPAIRSGRLCGIRQVTRGKLRQPEK